MVRKGDTEGLSEEVEERIGVWGKREDQKDRKKKKHVEKMKSSLNQHVFQSDLKTRGKTEKSSQNAP